MHENTVNSHSDCASLSTFFSVLSLLSPSAPYLASLPGFLSPFHFRSLPVFFPMSLSCRLLRSVVPSLWLCLGFVFVSDIFQDVVSSAHFTHLFLKVCVSYKRSACLYVSGSLLNHVLSFRIRWFETALGLKPYCLTASVPAAILFNDS